MSEVWEKVLYKLKGIDRDVKRAYQALFNSSDSSKKKITITNRAVPSSFLWIQKKGMYAK